MGKPNAKKLISRLSPSCRELLDRLLDVDTNTRIRMDQLKTHPWFIRKLPEIFELKLKKLEQKQLQLNNFFQTKQINKQTDEIKDLIEEAGLKASDLTRYNGYERKQHVNKNRSSNKRIRLKTGIDTFTVDRTYEEHTSLRVAKICSKIDWEMIDSIKN